MKKLMIAATAAMAGATTFGGLCDPESSAEGCSVYNIKFTFKTLAPKEACKDGAKWLVTASLPGTPRSVWYRYKDADDAAQAIADAANRSVRRADYLAAGQAGTQVCDLAARGPIQNADFRRVFWMDNATRKFDGIAWQCKSDCFEGVFSDCDLNNNGRLNYVIWEKKNSLAISFPVFQVKYGATTVDANNNTKFDGTPSQLLFSRDAQLDMTIGRYGNKAQKVAALWNIQNLLHSQWIVAAGFGTYDVNNLRTKSVSGNAVAGIMPVSDDTDECGNVNRIFCALGFMCSKWENWCCDGCYAGVELVPASGTWSLKYNASATKKADANKSKLSDFVPKYMFYSHSAWNAARQADPWLHNDNYYWWDDTNNTLFYKGGDNAAADLTADQILDYIANGACTVINIVFDGVYDSTEKKYSYGQDYALEGKILKADEVFGEAPKADDNAAGGNDPQGGQQ